VLELEFGTVVTQFLSEAFKFLRVRRAAVLALAPESFPEGSHTTRLSRAKDGISHQVCSAGRQKKKRHVRNDVRQLSETSRRSYTDLRSQYYCHPGAPDRWMGTLWLGAVTRAVHELRGWPNNSLMPAGLRTAPAVWVSIFYTPSGSCYAVSEQVYNMAPTRLTFFVPCQRRQVKHQRATYVCGM